jgi:hypothetical protein
MRLIIQKDQSKGLMGGVSFEVAALVKLTPEERHLVQHYKMENHVLFSKKMVTLWGTPTDQEIQVRVNDLAAGTVYKCKDLNEVINLAESVKRACESLSAYLEVASTFGGEEVYEFVENEEGERQFARV